MIANKSFNSTLVRFTLANALKPTVKVIESFNSTLVRFTHLFLLCFVSERLRFQFHAGSIHAQDTHIATHSVKMFQFHAGSIHAWRSPRQPRVSVPCFNSTLVRFTL